MGIPKFIAVSAYPVSARGQFGYESGVGRSLRAALLALALVSACATHASITYPSGKQLTHQYDAIGQLTALHWGGQPLVTGLTWNPLGQPTGWQWPAIAGGESEARQYDTAGQLTHSALLDLTWDAAGRIRQITQQHMLPATSNSVPQQAGLSSAYTYDANGNRTQACYGTTTVAGSATLQRVYQSTAGSNRISGYTQTYKPAGGSAQPATITAYSYDATGALTKKGDHHLHQNAQGRIPKASLKI